MSRGSAAQRLEVAPGWPTRTPLTLTESEERAQLGALLSAASPLEQGRAVLAIGLQLYRHLPHNVRSNLDRARSRIADRIAEREGWATFRDNVVPVDPSDPGLRLLEVDRIMRTAFEACTALARRHALECQRGLQVRDALAELDEASRQPEPLPVSLADLVPEVSPELATAIAGTTWRVRLFTQTALATCWAGCDPHAASRLRYLERLIGRHLQTCAIDRCARLG